MDYAHHSPNFASCADESVLIETAEKCKQRWGCVHTPGSNGQIDNSIMDRGFVGISEATFLTQDHKLQETQDQDDKMLHFQGNDGSNIKKKRNTGEEEYQQHDYRDQTNPTVEDGFITPPKTKALKVEHTSRQGAAMQMYASQRGQNFSANCNEDLRFFQPQMEIQIVQSQMCISQESRSRISCIDKDDAGDGYGNRFARFDDCNEPRIHDDPSIRNSGSGGPNDTCRSDDTNREDCIPARQGMIPPPAPRKPKAKPRGNYALRKGGCNFFTPPDLELFFASISSSSNIF